MNSNFSLALEAANRLLFLAALGRLDNETLAAAAAEKEGVLLPLQPVEAPSEPPVEAKEDNGEEFIPRHMLGAARREANRAAGEHRRHLTRFSSFWEHHSRDERKAVGRAKFARRDEMAQRADADWERVNARRRTFVPFMLAGVSRQGAEALVRQGMVEFKRETGVDLPWNLYKDGPLIGWPKKGRIYGQEGAIEHYARLGGFLRKAATSTAARPLVRFIKKATSNRGQGSRRTQLNVANLPEVFGSPEAASIKLVAIRRRANEILEPYGVRVSTKELALIMRRFRRTGKAAHQAAMSTLRDVLSRKFGIASYGMSQEAIFMAACGLKAALGLDWKDRERLGRLVNGKEVKNLRAALAAQQQIAA